MRMKVAICCLACAVLLAGCGGGTDPEPEKPDPLPQPFARTDIATMTYTEEDYTEALSRPYWLGNVLYNEIAIAYEEEDGRYANLLYKPERVIRVTDRTLSVVYTEGEDYTVDRENGRLVIPAGSRIPTLSPRAEYGKDLPDGYEQTEGEATGNKYQIWNNAGRGNYVYTEGDLFYGRYLSVTYAYDAEELRGAPFAAHRADCLTGVRAKLERGEDITLGVLGDSIAAGCSSTGDVLHVAPYTPGFVNQVKAEIERVYGVTVNLVNGAAGGTGSAWPLGEGGKASLHAVQTARPDLVLLAYGMNDGAPNPVVKPPAFGENLASIIGMVRAWAPGCEFLLINSFPSHPRGHSSETVFGEYWEQMEALGETEEGVCAVDLQCVGNAMLARKKYAEIASNNANHPNDFMHRVYAMCVMNAIFDYTKTE